MTERHQRLDLQAVPSGDRHAAGIVVARRPLLDVGEDALVPRFEPDENPPETRAVHRLGLLVGEQLRLDETAKPELHAESLLRPSNQLHQLDDLWD